MPLRREVCVAARGQARKGGARSPKAWRSDWQFGLCLKGNGRPLKVFKPGGYTT